MARTKQVHRKDTSKLVKVARADARVQSLPLPDGVKKEGELLYRQHFMLYGMSPELRERLKQVLNWTDKQITTHMKYMTKQWRRRKDDYKRSIGFPIKKRRYRPGTLALRGSIKNPPIYSSERHHSLDWSRKSCMENLAKRR